MSKRIRATSTFHKNEGRKNCRAVVPAIVRNKLEARTGDTLVFEEGGFVAAEKAAARGPYFIVSLERRKVMEEVPAQAMVVESVPTAHAPEPFAEAVRKKREERSMPAQ